VYFPEPSVGSIVAIAGGEKLEVGIFGPEGMSGLAVVNGTDRGPHQSFIQVAGQGLRIRAGDLRRAIEASPSLHGILLRYSQAYTVQVAFTALANGRYTIDERLARWLLMCHDRVDGDVINLTHEFLALMLGVRRAGVTTAVHILEGAKVVSATRGRLEILSREALLENAGDSYGPPEAEYERLLRLS
jgi:CRP-like cAMP-binding protein